MGVTKTVQGGVVRIAFCDQDKDMRVPPLTKDLAGDPSGLVPAPQQKDPTQNQDPFSWLLSSGAANTALCQAVRTIQQAVSEVVDAWCAGVDEHRQGHFRSLGASLLREAAKNLGIWFLGAQVIQPTSGGNLRVPRPGILVFTDRNGLTQIDSGELQPMASTRRNGTVTEIITPTPKYRDALRALTRLTDQLSEETSEGNLGLSYHADARGACDRYREAVLAALRAIADQS